MKRRALWLLLPLAGLALDFSSKVWILAQFSVGETRTVIPDFFNLTLGYNTGAIFGILSGVQGPMRTLLFTLVGLLAMGFFGYELLRERQSRLNRIALGLILGGVLGNTLDRILHGAVVDYLDFYYGTWHYWTFNIADSCIVCGSILMAWGLIFQKNPSPSSR